MRFLLCALAVVAASLGAGDPPASDWPQWRGPNRDGISAERSLLQAWPAAGPPLKWSRSDIGSGFSAPAIAGRRLFLLSNRSLDNEFVEAMSVDDGRTLWTARVGRVGQPNQSPSHPAARSTPTVAGDWLYALGSDGDLVCLAVADGRERWRLNVRAAFNGKPGEWAYAESPRVDGSRVVVTPGGREATMVALEASTGAIAWKAAIPGSDAAAYSSISVATVGEQRIYVTFVEGGLIGVDAASGAFLWRYDKANRTMAKIPTPVTDGANVYTASAPVGGALLRLERTDAGIEAREIYLKRGLPYSIGGSVLVNGYLYGTTADGLVAAAFDTGTIAWTAPSIGPASVLYADGRLYLHGENGDVALVEPSPDGYREHGRFAPPNRPPHPGDMAWTYPAVARGTLFIREHGSIWAYDIRQPSY